jgi:LacI family transcriptional regulator
MLVWTPGDAAGWSAMGSAGSRNEMGVPKSNGTGSPAESRTLKTPATIYDVARMSGVSPSTVSRALSKPGRLNAATEQRIREVAAAAGYRLNPLARALPTGRTKMLALIVSDITNPVFFELVRGAERVAADEGYILILAESQESAELEQEAAQRLMPSVDGLILVSTRLSNAAIQDLGDQKPLLVVNRRLPGVDSLVPDVVPGISGALDHLAEHGHRRVAFLAGPSTSWMSRLRQRTAKKLADERGMEITVLGPADPTLEGGASAVPALLTSGATAVLAYNDLMAIGILRGASDAGVSIPRDLSIVGFDDIFGSDFTSPPITTIRTPLGSLGDQAAHRLIARLDDDGNGRPAQITTEFVPRGSTARVRD